MISAPLRVAVLGPGAVGGLIAALLARAGNSVVVLAGESTTQAIAGRGLSVESRRFGDFHITVDTAVRLQSKVDFCLVTVKATQLDEALERVAEDALGDAVLVPFLNGIDHVDRLRRAYPSSSVAAATIRIEAAKAEVGVIRQLSPFAAIDIAPPTNRREQVDRLVEQLVLTGFDVRVREDELQMLWDKLALLAPLALLTTHARANVAARFGPADVTMPSRSSPRSRLWRGLRGLLETRKPPSGCWTQPRRPWSHRCSGTRRLAGRLSSTPSAGRWSGARRGRESRCR